MNTKQSAPHTAMWREACQVYASKGNYVVGNRENLRGEFSSPDRADEVFAKVVALIQQELAIDRNPELKEPNAPNN